MSSSAGTIIVDAVPVRLFLESQDHQHDLIRELKLIEMADRFDLATRDVSRRLATFIGEILDAWDDVRSTTRQQALHARDQGDEHVALVIPVRPGLADALRTWVGLLDEADRFCNEGELLTVAASPEVRRLRHWYVERIVAELDTLPTDG